MSARKKTATRDAAAAKRRLEDRFLQDSTALAYCRAHVLSTMGVADLDNWDALWRRNVALTAPQVRWSRLGIQADPVEANAIPAGSTAEEPQPIIFYLAAPLV